MILFYLIDGARNDVMEELLQAGELPNIEREILSRGTFRTAVSCLPSTSGPAYLPFLTGCFPGTLNLPGIRWLDKTQYNGGGRARDRFRSYMGYEGFWINSDLAVGSPTLFELFPRSASIFSMITRGLRKGGNATARSRPFLYSFAHFTHRWGPVNEAAIRYVRRCLDDQPDVMFVVIPGVDSFSHLHHPRHPAVLDTYRLVDDSVGEIVAELKRRRLWDTTLMILTSDHGLTTTHGHLDLAQFLENRGLRTLYYPLVWKRRAQASVMISGNAFGHVYLLDGHAHHFCSGAEIQHVLGDVWPELLERKEVDFIACRREPGAYEVWSARGRALVTHNGAGFAYEPETGDPLGLGALRGPLNTQDALAQTFASDYPDALVQIHQLFRSPRCGDFFVVARNGYDLRDAWEWPEHRASHGSLHREHMLVPLLYNQAGWRDGPCRTTDLFPSMLRFAGEPIPELCDGQPLL